MDEYALLAEFEKMLHGEDNNYEELASKTDVKPDKCFHVWEQTGRSPIFDTPWYNCKKCKIKKEKYEQSKEFF